VKALILDGSRNGDDFATKVRGRMDAQLAREGWERETFLLRDQAIAP
jgi:hypothetical protein